MLSDSDKIKYGRKETRPSYYDSASKTEKSLDFEAYLILLGDSKKHELISQLKKVKKEGNKRKDRDELLSLALSKDLSNAKILHDAASKELSEFTEFRNNLSVEGYAEVTELGQLISNLQLTIDEDLHSYDRIEHLQILTEVLQLIFNQGKLSEDTIKELDSWLSVINEYSGLGGFF